MNNRYHTHRQAFILKLFKFTLCACLLFSLTSCAVSNNQASADKANLTIMQAQTTISQPTEWAFHISGDKQQSFIGLADKQSQLANATFTTNKQFKGKHNIWGINLARFSHTDTYKLRFHPTSKTLEFKAGEGKWLFVANLTTNNVAPFMVTDKLKTNAFFNPTADTADGFKQEKNNIQFITLKPSLHKNNKPISFALASIHMPSAM